MAQQPGGEFFPAPPSGLGSYASLAAQDDYMASPGQQVRQQQPGAAPLPQEREAAADAAITDSLRHVVSEYARRTVEEAMDEAFEPGECQLNDVEFVAQSHLVNDIPCLVLLAATSIGLLPIFTQPVLITIGGGAVLTYTFDFLGHRRATMSAMLFTLLAGWLMFYFSNFADAWNSPSAMLVVVSVALIFGMVALRGLVSFKSLQTDNPGFSLMAEAAVNSMLPMTCAPPIIAAVIGMVGPRLAPFAMVPLMCTIHYFFYLPMQSSFLEIATDVRRKAAEELVLMIGPFEAMCGTIFMVLLPLFLFPALDHEALLPTTLNVFNYVFLVCGPLLYLVAMDPKLTLWFLKYYAVGSKTITVKPSVQDEEDALEVRESTRTVRITALEPVIRYRFPLIFIFYSGVMHFAVERLINSRFAYLVVGVPPPLNYLLLVVVGYLASLICGAGIYLALDDEAAAKNKKDKKDKASVRTAEEKRKETFKAALWIGALLAAVVASVGIGIVAGMPGFFLPMMALSAACFVAYLIDRRATNNFVTFMCATTITLTWWMFKTFSFIHQDLRVIGDKFTVTTNDVAGAVLLAYILGGSCIPFAFKKTKGPLVVCMVLHGLKVSFIEHVLYSQTNDSAYPWYFVAATSVMGIVVAYRLFINEVFTDIMAAYIIGLYGSKFFVYLVQINVAQNEDTTYALEMFVTELFSMAACAVLAIAELRHRRNVFMTAGQFMTVIVSWFAVLAVGMRDTVLRVVVEEIGINRPSTVQLTAASGVACAAFGFVTAGRYTSRLTGDVPDEHRELMAAALKQRQRLRMYAAYLMVASIVMLVIDPSVEELLTGEGSETLDDNPYMAPWWSRWAVAFVLGLLFLSARLPIHELHPLVRGFFFVGSSVLISIAASPIVIPASDVRVVAALSVFLSAAAATVVACHHGRFESDVCLVMYLVSLVALALGFISLNYVSFSTTQASGHLAALEAEAHALSRMGMLSIGAATNLCVALTLKFYLNGRPLLAGARKLQGTMGSQVALVCNYAVIIAYTTLTLLAYWVEAESSAMLVAASPVLLLLHNDTVLLTRLSKGPFRYFPPFAAVCVTLIWHVGHEAHDFYLAARAWKAGIVAFGVLACALTHVPLAWFLWSPKKQSTTVGRVFIMLLWDALILLATPSVGVRWLAAVGIVALIGRLVVSGHLKGLSAAVAAM